MLVRRGKFGPIQVVEREGTQALLLNGQVQGAAFLQPSARDVGVDVDGPGPVSSSPYTYGWLLAGLAQPYGSGLMVGLGSGAGAIQLLANFPHVDLTVVEIDPVMAEVALRSFPLLDYYLNQGRLDIVLADANDYLNRAERFQFGMADAYDGGESYKLITGYLKKLCQVCDDVLINAIDSPDCTHLLDIAVTCGEVGKPLRYVMEATPPNLNLTLPKANYIMTSLDLDPQVVDAFDPFPSLEGDAADFGRACWAKMVGTTTRVGC